MKRHRLTIVLALAVAATSATAAFAQTRNGGTANGAQQGATGSSGYSSQVPGNSGGSTDMDSGAPSGGRTGGPGTGR